MSCSKTQRVTHGAASGTGRAREREYFGSVAALGVVSIAYDSKTIQRTFSNGWCNTARKRNKVQSFSHLHVGDHLPGLTACAHNHTRSEEHTSELQSLTNLVCRLLLE